MDARVLLEVAQLDKGARAPVADEGLLVRVDKDVAVEGGGLGEGLAALRAVVGLLARVQPQVVLEKDPACDTDPVPT